MNAVWIAVMIPFVSCSSLGDAEWNYPYHILNDYLGYLIPNTPEEQYFNSRARTYHFKYDTGSFEWPFLLTVSELSISAEWIHYSVGRGREQSFRGETRDQHGIVRGYYGYIDPHGVLRITEYIADHLGYRVKTTLRYLVSDA